MSEDALKEIKELEEQIKNQMVEEPIDCETNNEVRKSSDLQPKEEIKEEIKEESKVELSDVEKEALEMGWNPDGPKSADEWVKYAPVYKEKQTYKKRMEKLEKMVETMSSQLKTQRDLGYQQAIQDLEQQQKEAVAEGDVERYDHLKAEIDKQNQLVELQNLKNDFESKFGDLLNDPEMELKILGIDSKLMREKLSPKDHFKKLEDMIKDIIEPNEVKEVKSKPSPVSSNVNKVTKSPNKVTKSDLRGHHRQIAEYLTQHPENGITVDEYIQGLIKNGEL